MEVKEIKKEKNTKTKELPLKVETEMIYSLLNGIKTQFRKPIKVQVLLNNGFNVNVTNLTNIFNVMQCRHPVNITYDQKHLFYITKFSGKN